MDEPPGVDLDHPDPVFIGEMSADPERSVFKRG
jgi:hypothetical protein